MAELPLEASVERELLQTQGIQSLLALPIVRHESLIGLLGVHSVKQGRIRSDGTIELLRMLANFVADVLEHQRSGGALMESEERYRCLADATMEGIVVHDGTHVLDVNSTCVAMFGFARSEFIGERGLDFIAPESRQLVAERIRTECEEPYEAVALRKDGSRFPIEICARRIPYKGKMVRVVAVRDVTEWKQAEEALRASENKYRVLVENLPQKIFLKDRNSVYISCNENYAQDLGIKPGDIAGNTDYDFHPMELAEKYRADDQRIMESGEAEEIEEKYIQGGKEVFVHTVKTPIRDEYGCVSGILGIFWDITKWKRAEDEAAWQQDIVAAINTILRKVLTCESEEDLAKTCLEVAQELVGAKFGFFGEVNLKGKFDTLAISNPGWDECRIPESQATKIIKGMEIRGMQFLPLKDGKSRIFNDPSNHPESVGVPEGHPEITCLLAVPLKYGGKVIGQIGLGNKKGGYDLKDQEAIEALSSAMVEALMRKRAEKALRESEARFRTSLDNMLDGFAIFASVRDETGKIIDFEYKYINEAGCRFNKGPRDEFIGSRLLKRWSSHIPTGLFERYCHLVETGIPVAEDSLVYEDVWVGRLERRVLDIRAAKLGDGFAVAWREVTDRERMEADLRGSERRFRELAHLLPQVIYETDLEGNFTFVNRYSLALFGYTQEDLNKGLNNLQMLIPEDRDRARENALRILNGECSNGNEYTALRKDGTTFPVIIYSSPAIHEGESVGMRGIIIDISQRKQAEAALKESEGDYRTLFENMLSGFAYCKILLDENNHPVDFVYLEINDAFERITTLKRKDVIGKRVTEAIPTIKDAHPELFEIYGQVALTGKPTEFTIFFEPLKIWLSISVHCPRREYFVAEFENITERKKAEETVRAAIDRSQKQQKVVGDIAVSAAVAIGDVVNTAKMVAELASQATGVERVGVWLFDEKEEELRCVDLYEASVNKHSSGTVLQKHEYQNEFEALIEAKYVDADDPLTDPRTAGYVDGYLKPLGITSMLDAVVRASGRNLGVLCFEHVKVAHHWEEDEIAFACQLADQISLTILNREQRQAEEALRKSEEGYRTLVEQQREGVVIADPAEQFIFCNPAAEEIFGVPRGTLVGRNFEEFVSAQTLELIRGQTDKRREGEKSNYEIEIIRPSGEKRHIVILATPWLDEKGDFAGAWGIFRDETERKRAEAELRFRVELENLISTISTDFINLNSHEIDCGINRALQKIGESTGATAVMSS